VACWEHFICSQGRLQFSIFCVLISFFLKIKIFEINREGEAFLSGRKMQVSVLCLSLLCTVLFLFLKDSLNFFFGRLVWPPVRLHNPETNGRGTKIKADLLCKELVESNVKHVLIKGTGHHHIGIYGFCPIFALVVWFSHKAEHFLLWQGSKLYCLGARLSELGYDGTLAKGRSHVSSKPPCTS
jgi:hypothetical protein